MAQKNKYNIGDRVKTKIHYQNDSRTEVEAEIRGVELVELDNTEKIKYKIIFEPEEFDKGEGAVKCIGYIYQDDIISLCN